MVRATALRKLRRSKVDLSLNELEVLAQQIRADLERIDGGTGTASSSHTAGETAHKCHGGHGQSGPRESGIEHAAVLCSGPCDVKRNCGGVDREKRETRRRCCGLETDPERVCLDRAGKRSRHVVQVGRSSVSSGLRHCGRHQQDGRGHDQVPEAGWGKSVRHHQERHPHEGVDKRSRATEARVSQQHTPQHEREDAGRGDVSFDGRAGSARTDGRRPDGDWSRRQERQEGHRQERKGQERSEGSGKRP